MSISSPTVVQIIRQNLPQRQLLVAEYTKAEKVFSELLQDYTTGPIDQDVIDSALVEGYYVIDNHNTITITQPCEVEVE